jgi:hypothetical protein
MEFSGAEKRGYDSKLKTIGKEVSINQPTHQIKPVSIQINHFTRKQTNFLHLWANVVNVRINSNQTNLLRLQSLELA